MKEEAKLKIREGIELLKNYNFPNYKTIEEATAYIREAIKIITGITDEEKINELEIPWIANYYYPARQNINTDIIIPLYITDFYQKEYTFNDNSEYFTVKYEVDGVEHQIENIPAGDYNLHLGQLSAGMHYYGVQIVDSRGRSSRTIFNDLWIVDPVEYEIKESETYTITDNDLATYSINKNNSEVVDDMINNRVGLSQLFSDLQSRGYRKAILPTGIYRINRCFRLGTIESKDTPIQIPTNFTLDMNGSTFKLHPYSDSEYGSIAHVENLMVRMYNCVDSHIINGTFEGDYAERQQNGWISGSNGEHNNTFYSYGTCFSSLDNITIKQTTGYNVCSGQSGNFGSCNLPEWFDNIVIENGEEKTKEGFVTSGLGTMSQALIDSKYLVYSVWLGMGGLRGLYWEIEFHFYDESQNFIKTIKSYQFTRCRIPEGAKYVRVTLRGDSSQVSGVSLHHMKSNRYFECNDCHWEDNRTCSAVFQVQHYAFNRCTFARSGQILPTPCEIDLEDGWEQQQDIFMNNCETIEASGTGGLIDNSGLNHVIDNCKNIRCSIRYRVRGLIMRNCTGNSTFKLTSGFMTGNTVKVENNNLTDIGYDTTGIYNDYDKVLICYKNNVINSSISVNKKSNIVFDSNTHLSNQGDGYIIRNATIKPTGGYIHDNILVEDSDYFLSENETQSIFSFNRLDGKRIYRRCIFHAPCTFKTQNYFNSGLWEDCVFKDTLTLNPTNRTLTKDQIQFNNCTFEKEITINLGKDTHIQFNKCTFLGNINYIGTSNERCEFNDVILNNISYFNFTPELEYMKLNTNYGISIYKLPFSTSDKLTLNFDNTMADIDINEANDEIKIIPRKVGEFKLTATSLDVQNECIMHFVDVDYSVGQYINDNGNIANFMYNVLNNRYDEVSKTNITITTPFEVTIIRVAQYDVDKNFIKLTNIGNTSTKITTGSCVLDSNCKYIRIAFRYATSSEKRFPQLFAMYTIK